MAARKSSGGMVKQILIFFLACGFGLAVLRVFNYDPFGVVDWLFSWASNIIGRIADFFSGNETFQKATRKPE
jgi:putative flippase GtrA